MRHRGGGEGERWNAIEYAAGYRARMSEIPDAEGADLSWCMGWEDADTELLESGRHARVVASGREEDYPDTWSLLAEGGSKARESGIPFDIALSAPWKQGWIRMDILLGEGERSQ